MAGRYHVKLDLAKIVHRARPTSMSLHDRFTQLKAASSTEAGITKRVNDRVASAKNRRLALQLSKRSAAQAGVGSTGNGSNRFNTMGKNKDTVNNTGDARYRLNDRINRSGNPSNRGDVKLRLGYPPGGRGSPTRRGGPGGRGGLRGNWGGRGQRGRIRGRGRGRGAYRSDWNPVEDNSRYNDNNNTNYQMPPAAKNNRPEYQANNQGRRRRGRGRGRGRRNRRGRGSVQSGTQDNYEDKDDNRGNISIQISNDHSDNQEDDGQLEEFDDSDLINDNDVDIPLDEEMETEIE